MARAPKPKKSGIEAWVDRHRAEVVVCIVLPISMMLWLWRSFTRWLYRPSPEHHAWRVAAVAAEVRGHAAAAGLIRTDRSVYESHSVRNSNKTMTKQVKLRGLYAILGLSDDRKTVHLEPGVTVGEATAWLLERGLMLECTLEMADATLGGLAMAQGMTTHSHCCGLLHETITEWELVTGDADVVLATATNEHADLFRTLPLSHGSLGLLVSLRLRVTAAKPWVLLKYTPIGGPTAAEGGVAQAFNDALSRRGADAPFFLEGIVFSRTEAVLMRGRLVDSPDALPGVTVNEIGKWWKPWFFKHVEAQLEGSLPRASAELIPIWDYLMRHDRSMCMTMATVIPYGNHPLFRLVLGWLLPPQMSFLKASHTPETRDASIFKQVYQDISFPAAELDAGLTKSHELFDIYPLLLYPCALKRNRGGMLRVGATGDGDQLNANLGIYGVPRQLREQPDRPFATVKRVRALEAWVRSVGGFQHTYCDSFQSREEFEEMFDHDGGWREARLKYRADGRFPTVYDKTRPEVDVFARLALEEISDRKPGHRIRKSSDRSSGRLKST